MLLTDLVPNPASRQVFTYFPAAPAFVSASAVLPIIKPDTPITSEPRIYAEDGEKNHYHYTGDPIT